MGLACVADYTIGHAEVSFGLPEAKIGLVPAQVAPYVVSRIGQAETRRLALCGLMIGAEDAKRIGLMHEVFTDEDNLEHCLKRLQRGVSGLAPSARAETKSLLFSLLQRGVSKVEEHLIESAAHPIVDALTSPGFWGGDAMKTRRPPQWLKRWLVNDPSSPEEER